MGLIFLLIMIFIVTKRYIRCPSDKILVVYGKVTGSGPSGIAKTIHGGAVFVLPIIQDYKFLDLTPIPIVVDLRGAINSQNIRVNLPSRFMVSISPEEAQNAVEYLLDLNQAAIHDLAADIIFGQLRVVVSTIKIEEIIQDREKFIAIVSETIEHKLNKIGLKLINVNLTDITDDDGYIDALRKKAKKLVTEKNNDD